MADNVELVRRLWSAFERGGIEAVLEIVDADVEWEPYAGGGTVYRGHEGLRGYIEERRARNEETDGRLYSAFARGDYVVARGELRIRGDNGLVTMQPGWLYEFRDGKLIRFRGFPTQEAALRAAGLAPQDAAAIVRELIGAFNRRDYERMRELVAPDCRFRAYSGTREVYVGPQGVQDYVDERFGNAASVTVTEYAFREIGNLIAVSGSLNLVDERGAIVQGQVHWLFRVEHGLLAEATSFARREHALAAANAGAESG